MSTRLTRLRELFFDNDLVGPHAIDIYILPRTDPHKSEYLAVQHERVAYISGFTGSNAFTIITLDKAHLWTDGRYFFQALSELVEGWQLMRDDEQNVLSPMDWIIENIDAGSYVGFDPHLFSHEEAKDLLHSLNVCKAVPIPIQKNLIDVIWRPAASPRIIPITKLSFEEGGADIATKIFRVREVFNKKKCDSIIISDLAEIAWLFNLRGSDIPFNPVFFAVVVITNLSVHLFVDENKFDDDIRYDLRDVEIHPYNAVTPWLNQYHINSKKSNGNHKIWIPASTNYAWTMIISEEFAYHEASPIKLMKAIKNDAELAGMRNAHIRDSAAILEFFFWLENELNRGAQISEKKAAEKLLQIREKDENFVSESFEAISAVAEHAAFPHYHMTERSGQTLIDPDEVYLIDSGGQYRDGTTDVTRTLLFGSPPDDVMKMFTLVLKGHIANASQIFPNRTNATRLDALARMSLWQQGFDFDHGVGHGVGHFSEVHEFPPSIGFRQINPRNVLMERMIVTIEPGYYALGQFGIRIENAYELVSASGLESNATNFIKFRSLTWVPIQKSLIQKDLLTTQELEWLNNYHAECLQKTGSYLKQQGLNDVYDYLKKWCEPMIMP